MNRLDAEVDQDRVDYWRDYHVTASATQDQSLDPEDRRDRAEVLVGSTLERDDDVLILDVIPMRIVGPGEGRKMVLGYLPEEWGYGDTAGAFEINPGDLTDRARVDTNKPNMPIWEEP